jgi:hypothetical protein
VGAHLEKICPELQGAVLVIHTVKNGEISEAASSKNDKELGLLREQSNAIDTWASPFKAIVSVLMLKEGWDVRNVTTIVGLRAYSAQSNILPEQTLGRGLRKMYPGDLEEYVSVVGTTAFMDFVDSIQAEGVVLERKPMGEGTQPKTPLVVEIDKENEKKDIDALDIEIPVLTPRVYREYKNLSTLDVGAQGQGRFGHAPPARRHRRRAGADGGRQDPRSRRSGHLLCARDQRDARSAGGRPRRPARRLRERAAGGQQVPDALPDHEDPLRGDRLPPFRRAGPRRFDHACRL